MRRCPARGSTTGDLFDLFHTPYNLTNPYDLQSSTGLITGNVVIFPGTTVNTTLGALRFSSGNDGSFKATVIPIPAGGGLFGAALAVLATARRQRGDSGCSYGRRPQSRKPAEAGALVVRSGIRSGFRSSPHQAAVIRYSVALIIWVAGHMRRSLFSLVVLLVSLVAGPVNADAFSDLMQLADQGDADAQYKLGVMYGDGLGVKRNSAEAVRWYRKAADQGHVDAQLNLGAAYTFGFGVKGNSAEAVRWYQKAADQGHADAQLNLCLMYARGHNVRQDNVSAYMLCSLAASPPTSRASDEAQQLLEFLTSNMTPAQITEAQKLAQEWKPTPPEKK